MRKTICTEIALAFILLGSISANAAQHRTVQKCVEVELTDISQKIHRLKSKCTSELRYINKCIRNPDNARGSRDRSRSKSDWIKLKKSVEGRCEMELAVLNRQKSEVWTLCKSMEDSKRVTDLLGATWEESETGIGGVWKRRGKSNVFDATWDNGAVAELTITLSGKDVRIVRKDIRGPNAGQVMDYEGAISEDGKTASGTMKSLAGQAPWSAAISE